MESEADTNWTAVIALANSSWLSPALHCSLVEARRIDELPDEARDFLGFLHERTRARNSRLREQLLEAISALNRASIEPIVLKGAIGLIAGPSARIGSRLMSDIDISVRACEVESAARVLAHIGYAFVEGDRAMARPSDAAMLELRAQPPAPPNVDNNGARSLRPHLVECEGTRAWVPSPTAQALHLIRHDMLKEGDYWRGRIDLRHLYDLARLADAGDVDWGCLHAQMTSNPGRNALATQLLTLRAIFGNDIPRYEPCSTIAQLQNWRRMTIAGHPVIGAPLRFAGNLAWGCKRMLVFEGLHRIGAAELARRAGGILMGTNTGPKI
jgi:hypothetical protein